MHGGWWCLALAVLRMATAALTMDHVQTPTMDHVQTPASWAQSGQLLCKASPAGRAFDLTLLPPEQAQQVANALDSLHATFGLADYFGSVHAAQLVHLHECTREILYLQRSAHPHCLATFIAQRECLFGTAGYALLLHLHAHSLEHVVSALNHVRRYDATAFAPAVAHCLQHLRTWPAPGTLGSYASSRTVLAAITDPGLALRFCSAFSADSHVDMGAELLGCVADPSDPALAPLFAAAFARGTRVSLAGFIAGHVAHACPRTWARNKELLERAGLAPAFHAVNTLRFGTPQDIADSDLAALDALLCGSHAPGVALLLWEREDVDWRSLLDRHPWGPAARMALHPDAFLDPELAGALVAQPPRTGARHVRFRQCLLDHLDHVASTCSADAPAVLDGLSDAPHTVQALVVAVLTGQLGQTAIQQRFLCRASDLVRNPHLRFNRLLTSYPLQPLTTPPGLVPFVVQAAALDDAPALARLQQHSPPLAHLTALITSGCIPASLLPRVLAIFGLVPAQIIDAFRGCDPEAPCATWLRRILAISNGFYRFPNDNVPTHHVLLAFLWRADPECFAERMHPQLVAIYQAMDAIDAVPLGQTDW